MFLEKLRAPRGGAHIAAPMNVPWFQNEQLFGDDTVTTRWVLLAPHRIPLKELSSPRKNLDDHGGLFPRGGRWVLVKNFAVQELKELREDRLQSFLLDQRDLLIYFDQLITKRQLHSVMEGLRQQSKSCAHDERAYGSINPGTVHRTAAKKPRTTYAPAVDPKSQQPSERQPGAGLPSPTSSVTRDNLATSQASAAAHGQPAPHGSGAFSSYQGEQEELSHAFEYETPSQPHPSRPSSSGRTL
ncbi:Hypothetical protein PHPALM_6373 [Phytophthora palmivora]|uniref:ATP-binding cassette (ABC) Superfamily n=1 Tax=Phytophthora palmivora TaxID=4796 RepID=A0A2P4YF05_9STRA|nr:Hypothetical protein PHPALM_6373 [Phytophthora palmivora]